MAAQAAGPTTTTAEARAADAWTVDARELDAEAEMRRTFGAKAVRAADAAEAAERCAVLLGRKSSREPLAPKGATSGGSLEDLQHLQLPQPTPF